MGSDRLSVGRCGFRSKSLENYNLQGHSTLITIHKVVYYQHELCHSLWDWTLQSIRTQFLDSHRFVYYQYDLWCTGCNLTSSPQFPVSYSITGAIEVCPSVLCIGGLFRVNGQVVLSSSDCNKLYRQNIDDPTHQKAPVACTYKFLSLESIQGISKHQTYRFEDTNVWEWWYLWRSEINIE